MSDRMRMTGMNSGMDTQSIVEQLVKAKSAKKEKLVKGQTKTEWKQEAWKDMNSKIYSFYTDQLDNLRLSGNFNKKKASIVDSSVASVSAANGAVTGTQSLAVKQVAKTAYLTGGKIENAKSEDMKLSGIMDLGTEGKTSITLKTGTGSSAKETNIELTSDMTLKEVASKFSSLGLNANFDEKNQRFFISAKESGAEADFSIFAGSDLGNSALSALGLSDGSTKVTGQDAVIELNGAEFTSSTNSFDINGLAITAQQVSAKDAEGNYVTTNVSVDRDVDGVYDMVKNFFKQYNELVNEMSKMYNADSAKKYEPLTDEEKEAMNDDEIEKWEQKIKDSLLRRDNDLNNVIQTMTSGMAKALTVNGKQYSLSSFGINTLSYFEAAENEKYAFHIDGDADDTTTKANTDKLKDAITNNFDDFVEYMSTLTKDLYSTMNKQMSRTEYRSIYHMYDDKALQSEYDKYKEQIAAEETRISDFEDKWYDKFAAMEKAMTSVNAKQSAISSLLGM